MRLDRYDLSGGQNSKVSPLFIKDNECEIVQNYHMDNVGALTKRYGTSGSITIAAIRTGTGTRSVLGLYFFNDTQGTDRSNLLAVVDDAAAANADIYALESAAWAISKADDTKTVLPCFCTFIDYVFRTNGEDVMGSSADPRPTGGSWGTTNCLATLKPKYCAVWEDRVYAAHENTSGSEKKSRIYWSSLPSAAGAITWTSSTDYADINPDDGDEITWIYPFGPRMLVFKKKGLYRWTFGQVEPDKIIDVGTPAGQTVKSIHGICFFANELGVWAYQGGQPRLISRKVQPFIDQISTLADMRAEVDNDHYYLYIGAVTVGGTTYTNAMLVYTISLDAWAVYTFPFDIKCMTRARAKSVGGTSTTDDIYVGDDDAYIYKMIYSNRHFDGDGTTTNIAINGYIRTKEYPLDFPHTSLLKQAYFLAEKAQGARINYRIDRAEEFKPLASLAQRITSKPLAGRAKTIQFTITDNSIVEGSRIEGFSVDYQTEEELRKEKK